MTYGDVTEAAVASAFGRTLPVDEAAIARDVTLLRSLHLTERAAMQAARGLHDGTYGSFEEAATMSHVFDTAATHGPINERRLAEVAAQRGGPRLLEERRSAAQTRTRVLESGRATASGDGKLSVCIISAGQGSCGFYPPATLEAAAGDKVFAKGTHCFLDHPTATEGYERPERSVRDLAGHLATDATFRDSALYADVTVYSQFRDLVVERAPVIGMSIRAEAVAEEGQVGDYRGPVVKQITKALSVDFVVAAGRGGRVVSVH